MGVIDFKKAAKAAKEGKTIVVDDDAPQCIECTIGHDEAQNVFLMLSFNDGEKAVMPEPVAIMLIQWMASLLEQDRIERNPRPAQQHIKRRDGRIDYLADKMQTLHNDLNTRYGHSVYVSPQEYRDDVMFLMSVLQEQMGTINRLTGSIESVMGLQGGLKNSRAEDMLEDVLTHAEIAGFY